MKDEQETRDQEGKTTLSLSAQESDNILQLSKLYLYRLYEQYYQYIKQHPFQFYLEKLGYRQQKSHLKRLGGVSRCDFRQ